MGFTWQVTPTDAFGQLADQYEKDIHTAVRQLAQRYAPEIEAWMKSNAKWQDQTGNARQSLKAEVEEVVNEMVSIVLSYGAPGEIEYAIFLELNFGGRLSVISPALDHFAPKIWADVQRLFS